MAMWESCPGFLSFKLLAELPDNHERSKWQQDLWFEISGMKDARKKKRQYKGKTESTEEENDKEMKKKKKKETEIDGGG